MLQERTFPPVNTKLDFYRRYLKGEFGNTSPNWDTLEEWQEANFSNPLGFAIRTKVPGGKCQYFLYSGQIEFWWKEKFIKQWGYTEEQLQISAQCPEQDKLLQGYYQLIRQAGGKGSLWYSFNKELPMRNALQPEHCLHAEGLEARMLIKNRMCPNSWEWFNILLDRYPEHTIEFTILKYPWGTLYPNYNTIFWEVRNY